MPLVLTITGIVCCAIGVVIAVLKLFADIPLQHAEFFITIGLLLSILAEHKE